MHARVGDRVEPTAELFVEILEIAKDRGLCIRLARGSPVAGHARPARVDADPAVGASTMSAYHLCTAYHLSSVIILPVP